MCDINDIYKYVTKHYYNAICVLPIMSSICRSSKKVMICCKLWSLKHTVAPNRSHESEVKQSLKNKTRVRSLHSRLMVCFSALLFVSLCCTSVSLIFVFASTDRCSAERRRQLPTHSRLGQSARQGAPKDRRAHTKNRNKYF